MAYGAAQRGDEMAIRRCVRAVSGLGRLFFDQKNYGKALEMLKWSAEKGDVSATTYLGVMYCQGLGVAKDRKAGMAYLEKGAEMGDPECARLAAQEELRG